MVTFKQITGLVNKISDPLSVVSTVATAGLLYADTFYGKDNSDTAGILITTAMLERIIQGALNAFDTHFAGEPEPSADTKDDYTDPAQCTPTQFNHVMVFAAECMPALISLSMDNGDKAARTAGATGFALLAHALHLAGKGVAALSEVGTLEVLARAWPQTQASATARTTSTAPTATAPSSALSVASLS